jgi:hypothetical protein
MEEENIYNDIQRIFDDLPENFNILEEQIDLEIQMKYFEHSKEVKKNKSKKDYLAEGEKLFLSETEKNKKKEILIGLAGVDDVKAYRIIERFLKRSKKEMRSWAVLALQENRMLLQTSLLDEKQYFISTGLGGKDKKLRYYVVFIHRNPNSMLNPTQQKLLKDELIFGLKPADGVFETIDFSEGFSSSQVLLPVTSDIKQVFTNVVEECNQYGNYLEDDMIITNVKILSRSEILEIISKQNSPDSEDELEDE